MEELIAIILTVLGSHWTSTVIGWAIFVVIVKTFGPSFLHKLLTDYNNNGGGERIRTIVNDQLVEQDKRQDEKLRAAVALNDTKLKEAFENHEKLEATQVALTLTTALQAGALEAAKLGIKLDHVEDRLTKVEQHIDKED